MKGKDKFIFQKYYNLIIRSKKYIEDTKSNSLFHDIFG